MFILPVLLAAVYWFLVLAPKRSEAGRLTAQLAKVERKRDDANGRANALESAKSSYAKDYETIVRVGKAVPSALDMPSLIVQLDGAAKGTGIRFKRIKAGARAEAPPPTPPALANKAAASGPGKARDTAKAGATTSEQASNKSGATPTSGSGGTAAAPAPGATPADGSSSGVAGLDSVPLEFTFTGSFFDLADFFHSMKRFVRVANKRVKVEGRLVTIDGFSFEASEFPTLKAEVRGTVYLVPKEEGKTAGATPNGPAPATTQQASSQSSSTPPASTPPPGAAPGGGGGAR